MNQFLVSLARLALTVLVAMLAVTSALADQQADLVARLRANPTEDFSGQPDGMIVSFAEADAMVYFETHTTVKLNLAEGLGLGRAQALKHNLMDGPARIYSNRFAFTLEVLATKDTKGHQVLSSPQ